MTQRELQFELAKLLEQIGLIVNNDLKGIVQSFNERETISYIFFIRVVEIFKAISILLDTDADQVTAINILLRSLSEYYILLKSSIEDESFNHRHLKQSGSDKEKWLDKVIKHHSVSGFEQDVKFFEEMKEKTRKFQEEYESNLQSVYQLFNNQNELPMYLHVYVPTSMYVHGNRQSFNVYHNQDGSVKSISNRDYSPLLRSAGLATGKVMLESYELFCKFLKHETVAIKQIEELLAATSAEIVKSMPSED